MVTMVTTKKTTYNKTADVCTNMHIITIKNCTQDSKCQVACCGRISSTGRNNCTCRFTAKRHEYHLNGNFA